MYYGNEFFNLGFELIVFDVGWREAEFVEDQVSRLGLDKADFEDSGIVTDLLLVGLDLTAKSHKP